MRERSGATLQLVAFALLINSSIWVADYPIPSVCFSAAVLRMFFSEFLKRLQSMKARMQRRANEEGRWEIEGKNEGGKPRRASFLY